MTKLLKTGPRPAAAGAALSLLSGLLNLTLAASLLFLIHSAI